MNFLELQDRTKFVLNNNDGQSDQDFSTTRIKQAINFAYNREVQKAMQEGSRRYFKKYEDISWTGTDVTKTLPASIKKKAILRIMDISDDTIGEMVLFSENGLTGEVFWRDNVTLQWGTTGPGQNKTLRVFYLATPEDLTGDLDEPALIPEQFHELIVWSAACWLRVVAEDAAPQEWQRERDELRLDLWKFVSYGRPRDDEPTVSPRDSDYGDEILGP